MSLPLIVLAAAASFACENPSHHDGDNLRCSNVPGSMRLQGIDAPEMPGACRPGRNCVDGDPFAARDYLRGLTAGKTLQCVQEDTDNYGRAIVNCTAQGVNISCAMIAGGHAVPRYAPIACGTDQLDVAQATAPSEPLPSPDTPPPTPEDAPVIVPENYPARAEPPSTAGWLLIPLLGLLLINAITWALFAIDKRRATSGRSRDRIAERTLLGWALVGGSPAAWFAINRLRHKSAKDSFKQPLLLISGLQIGALIGGIYLWFTG